jgi:uncharacterized membrane protein YkoI
MKKKILIAFGALSIAGVIGFTTFQSEIVNAEPKLTKDELRDIVTSQYPGTINELELEREGKRLFYEVEVALEGKKYELKMDANTGEVLKLEEKATNIAAATQSVDTNKNAAPKQTVISSEEAKKIALDNFAGTIVEMELDDDDSRHNYEIKIVNGNRKAEIEIDAYTGKLIVLDIETDESDFDDDGDDN